VRVSILLTWREYLHDRTILQRRSFGSIQLIPPPSTHTHTHTSHWSACTNSGSERSCAFICVRSIVLPQFLYILLDYGIIQCGIFLNSKYYFRNFLRFMIFSFDILFYIPFNYTLYKNHGFWLVNSRCIFRIFSWLISFIFTAAEVFASGFTFFFLCAVVFAKTYFTFLPSRASNGQIHSEYFFFTFIRKVA
jgi:hypothetical protein